MSHAERRGEGPSARDEAGTSGATTSDQVSSTTLLVIRLLSVAPLLVGGILYLLHPVFRDVMDRGVELLFQGDREGLRIWGAELGIWAPVATSSLMVVQAIAAPLPAVLVTATNSLLFGWVAGGVLSILSATFAAVVCYGLARGFGEPLVAGLISARARERSDRFLNEHGAAAVVVARLLPFVPFDPIGYLAGLARMRLWTFAWATIVGQIPAGMTYSYLAQKLDEPSMLVPAAICGVLGLGVIGVGARRVLLRNRTAGATEVDP